MLILRQLGHLTAKTRRFPTRPYRRFGFIGIFASCLIFTMGRRNCQIILEIETRCLSPPISAGSFRADKTIADYQVQEEAKTLPITF